MRGLGGSWGGVSFDVSVMVDGLPNVRIFILVREVHWPNWMISG